MEKLLHIIQHKNISKQTELNLCNVKNSMAEAAASYIKLNLNLQKTKVDTTIKDLTKDNNITEKTSLKSIPINLH